MVVRRGAEGPTEQLGQRLRQARLAKNYTQSDVAKNEFSVSYISAVERGQIRPSLGALEKLADRLNVPLADLLRDEQHPLPYGAGAAERGEAGERAEVEQRLREARILIYQGKPEEAATALRGLGRHGLSPRDQAALHEQAALAQLALGEAEEARRELNLALTLAEQANDADLRRRLRNDLGTVYDAAGKPELALEQYRETLGELEQADAHVDPAFQLSTLYHLGNAAWNAGDATNAIQYLQQAVAFSAQVLDPKRLGETYWALSTAAAAQNDARLARAYAIRSQSAYEEAANRKLTADVYNRLGRAYAEAGNPDEALVNLRTAQALAEQQGDEAGIADAQRALAAVYLAQGKIDDAAAASQQAADIAMRLGQHVEQAEVLLVQGRIEEARKHTTTAQQHFEQAVKLLEESGVTQPLSDAYKQYSAYLERQGDRDRALDLLKKAWDLRD